MKTKTEVIVVDHITIEIFRKQMKNMYLRVNSSEGTVRISAPKKTSTDSIRLFVTSKISWIKDNLDNPKKRKVQEPKLFVSGEYHNFLGKEYLLKVIETTQKQRVIISDEGCINLYVRSESSAEKREKLLLEWYRNQLKALIPTYIEKWEGIMEVNVNSWGVKLMKTRWGTCNIRDKRIWINLELAKKNPVYLEYVVVHEMVHLLEPSHNHRFKAYMSKFLPEWPRIKNELNNIGYK